MMTKRFIDDSNDEGDGVLFGLIDTETPSHVVEHPTSMADLAARFERLTSDGGDLENTDRCASGTDVVVRRHGDTDNGNRSHGIDEVLDDNRPVISEKLKKLRVAPIIDDDGSTYSSDESDIDEFLEYAREVIAQNNTSYDSGSFRDFESLIQESISNHFLDDDQDEDSLVSSSSFSGYVNEGGLQQKAFLLKNPIISDATLHRIQGIIARKKTRMVVESNANPATSDQNHDSVLMNFPQTNFKVYDSDELETPISSLSLQSFKESRISTRQRIPPKCSCRYEISLRDRSLLTSDTSSIMESPPPRPRRRKRKPHKSKKSKSSTKFYPAPRPQDSNSSRPPLSQTGTFPRRKAGPIFTWDSECLKPSDGEKRISSLIRNPENRANVLGFLKERAPNLYDSVLTRLQLESSIEQSPLKRFSDSDSVGFRTPEKRQRGSHPDLQINLYREPCWYINVDTTSVILPSTSRVVALSAVGSSAHILRHSNMDDVVDLFVTGWIDRVLINKQERVKTMKEKEYMIKEIQERFLNQQESITQRGMALIHKLRAKRKAALQAKYLQHSEQNHVPKTVFPSSFCIPESSPCRGVELSPEQLESYLSNSNEASPQPPPSSLEEKKERLHKLKEKRRRASFSRGDSEKTLLRYEAHDETFVKGRPGFSEGAKPQTSTASPFTTISFPRAKEERSYEVLYESFSQPAVTIDKSTKLKPSSSSLSVNRRKNRFLKGDLKSDGTGRIFAPESPNCLSPRMDSRINDSVESPNHISTIFEDTVSYDDDECLIQSSYDDGIWSDMSFHSDTERFTESATARDIPNFKGKSIFSSNTPTTKMISNATLPRKDEDNVTPYKAYNDSFDEIISRKTPSQKVSVPPGDDYSPTGVADFFLSTRSFELHRSPSLAFVDDEEVDPLFTDKEDSFDMSAPPESSSIQNPVFLNSRLFEI